jgi:hypothetical protein
MKDRHGYLFCKKLNILDELHIASILLNDNFFFDSLSNNLLFRKGKNLRSVVSIPASKNDFET